MRQSSASYRQGALHSTVRTASAELSLLNGGPEDSPRGIPLKPVTIIEIDTADDSVIIEGERIDLDWVENLAIGARACLELDEPPASGEYCEHCAYVNTASTIH